VEELGLVGDLAVVAVAALIGGGIARVLRLPTVLGYLAAGLAIGPNTPGPAGDIEQVQTVADLGVALLMFTLGIRFSLRELREVQALAMGGGFIQMGVMIAVGFAAGLTLGLDGAEAAIVGFVVAISSTMVALRLLEEKGAISGPEGRAGVAFALFQDIAVVPLIVLIPILGGEDQNVAAALGLAVLKAAGVLVAVWLIGIVLMPRVLERVMSIRSRELFLLSVVAFALGTASISFVAGLSLAFGAFLAGLLVSESEYAHQTLAEVFPLREVFAVVFFVAVGMLIEPQSFVDDPELVLTIAGLGLFGKLALVAGISSAFGFAPRAALTAGLALGNMGEFSFVIATVAMDEAVFDARLSEAVLAAVLLSIAVSPLLFNAQDRVWALLRAAPVVGPAIEMKTVVDIHEPDHLLNHAVIVGSGPAAEELMRALGAREFRYVIVTPDPVTFRRLSIDAVPCILGDASLQTVLEQAQLVRARVLAVTLTDVRHGENVVRTALQINPRLDVIARGGAEEAYSGLSRAGAAEVVHGDFEVGLEFARHALHRLGVSGAEIQLYLSRRRREEGER
jgi:CPA2 family monovalent cation:H+ antiporter-2